MISDIFYLSSYVEPEPILRDVFSGWVNGNGIFDALALVSDMPWKNSASVDSNVLDVAYFGNHSGGKFCSPLVKMLLDDEGEVPAQGRTVIAKIIVSKYLTNWSRLWETNVASYSPIHNYDMTENRILRKADSETENIGDTHTGTDTIAHGMKEKVDNAGMNVDAEYRYGFNTPDPSPKPTGRVDSTSGDSSTTEYSGSDVTTKNLQDSRNRNKAGAEEENEEIHRAGNIGVTTTQKLIQEERELWLWNYFNQVFADLDRELALLFHDPCRV